MMASSTSWSRASCSTCTSAPRRSNCRSIRRLSPTTRSPDGDPIEALGQSGARDRDATARRVDRQPERGLQQQENAARGPRLRRAGDRVERRTLAAPPAEAAEQLRHAVEIEEPAGIEAAPPGSSPTGSLEAVAGEARGDQGVVVRPDRAVVVRHRVVARLAGVDRPDAPARKQASSSSESATRAARSGRGDAGEQALSGVGRANRAGALAAVERQRVGPEVDRTRTPPRSARAARRPELAAPRRALRRPAHASELGRREPRARRRSPALRTSAMGASASVAVVVEHRVLRVLPPLLDQPAATCGARIRRSRRRRCRRSGRSRRARARRWARSGR